MLDAIIEAHGLSKRYGAIAALDDVSLSVRQGDIYGLVGRNGAGKTTFFKCLLGLARPSAGSIRLFGRDDLAGLSAMRRQVGFLVTASFYPYLGARQNLEYLCQVRGIDPAGEVDRLIELVGLTGVRHPFEAFSYGMKQRLGLAGALLGSPALLILDEPINGLDPQGIIDIRNILKAYNAQTGATLVVSSHILSELDLVATRFGFLEQGRLLSEITHSDLHALTKGALVIEVDDLAKANALLLDLGISTTQHDMRLYLHSHLDQAARISRLLVEAGLGLTGLYQQQTSLEDYFMRLIGGDDA
jgi:ABC-2 type transport system ATP-binding protein